MKFLKKNRVNVQGMIFMGASIFSIILLIVFTRLLDSYRYDLESEWSKMYSTIRSMEYYRARSYDQKRKFNLENRILFERIAADAIKVYTANTTNLYNDRIIEDMEKNTKLLDGKFNQIYKRDSAIVKSLPIPKEVALAIAKEEARIKENPTLISKDLGTGLRIETFEFHNRKFVSEKLAVASIPNFITPAYGVNFSFRGWRYGYISQKNFAAPVEMIDSQWVIF